MNSSSPKHRPKVKKPVKKLPKMKRTAKLPKKFRGKKAKKVGKGKKGGVEIVRTPQAVVIQPKQPEQPPQPPQPGEAPLVKAKPKKRSNGKVKLSSVKKARMAISSRNAVLSPMRRAQLYSKNKAKGSKRSPLPKNSGKTQLTKNKVEQIMPIEDLLDVVDNKPTFKYRFSCKSKIYTAFLSLNSTESGRRKTAPKAKLRNCSEQTRNAGERIGNDKASSSATQAWIKQQSQYHIPRHDLACNRILDTGGVIT